MEQTTAIILLKRSSSSYKHSSAKHFIWQLKWSHFACRGWLCNKGSKASPLSAKSSCKSDYATLVAGSSDNITLDISLEPYHLRRYCKLEALFWEVLLKSDDLSWIPPTCQKGYTIQLKLGCQSWYKPLMCCLRHEYIEKIVDCIDTISHFTSLCEQFMGESTLYSIVLIASTFLLKSLRMLHLLVTSLNLLWLWSSPLVSWYYY